MMADRGVARFLVAPRGFGKSMAVYEYAESIFEFENVFWISGQSPCFLRDLDDRVIAASLLDNAPRRSLIVFDDVPYLDDERSEAFSRDIDVLLAKEREVVVTMAPGADSFAGLQSDRCCITAHDLLVDDEEAAASGRILRGAAPCHRAACLVWGEDDGAALIEGIRGSDMPAEVQLALFVMEVLAEGSLDEAASFVHGFRKDTRRFVERHYPHIGIDLVEERFSVHEFPIGLIADVFRGPLDGLVAHASSMSRDALVSRLATELSCRGRFSRACDLMAALCPRKRRAAWMESSQERFFSAGELCAMQGLFESLGENPTGLAPALALGAAVRLFLLGDKERAERFAARALGHADCTQEQACAAALVVCSCATEGFPVRAHAVLNDAAARSIGRAGALSCAARSRVLLASDPEAAADVLQEAPVEARIVPAFVSELAHAIRFMREGRAFGAVSETAFQEACALAEQVLEAYCAAHPSPDAFEVVLRDALHEGPRPADEASERARAADGVAAKLVEQRRRWQERRFEPCRPARRTPAVAAAPAEIPVMAVRLFGGMEISVGGERLDSPLFQKQKAKTLLAILVLRRGKEVARQEILDIIWPGASGKRAVNNFYSLWSALRRALGDGRGECPYVVRHQTSCMVDPRYVESDVEEFDKACRMLLFGQPEIESWMRAFARLQDDFSCDLLPSETGNAFIERQRRQYRTRLVGAYTAAAERLCDIDEPRAALCFAYAAFEKSERREDVFCALMRAQMLAGQRSLAMETFMECKAFMAEELGMDLSERMMRLHRDLISDAHDGSLVSASALQRPSADVLK